MLKDWKTTMGGWIFAALILAADYAAHKTISAQAILTAASFAGLGTIAADAKTPPQS